MSKRQQAVLGVLLVVLAVAGVLVLVAPNYGPMPVKGKIVLGRIFYGALFAAVMAGGLWLIARSKYRRPDSRK